jgi:L-rhamnose mutarotase
MKQEIYLVVNYGIDGDMEVFKAYENKNAAKEVVKIKKKESRNCWWKVLPIHMVKNEA